MKILTAIFGLMFWFPGTWLLGQCRSLPTDIHRLSDRYTQAVMRGDHLYLGNSRGLTIRDFSNNSTPVLAQIPLAGTITRVLPHNDGLLAIAAGEGVYELHPSAVDGLIRPERFHPIRHIQDIAVFGDAWFARTADEILLHRRGEDGELVLQDRRSSSYIRIEATAHYLFALLNDSPTVQLLSYGEDGFSDTSTLRIDGVDIFYGFDKHEDFMVLDAFDGVRWLEIGADGSFIADGFLFDNSENQEVVLNTEVEGDFLFLRFTERLDVFQIANRNTTKSDSLLIPFGEFATTVPIPTGNHLAVLDTSLDNRLAIGTFYEIQEGRLVQVFRPPAQTGDITHAVKSKDTLFLASGPELLATAEGLPSTLDNLTSVRTFPGLIQHLTANEEIAMVVMARPSSTVSEGFIFDVLDDGRLSERTVLPFQGTVSGITQYGATIILSHFFRIGANTIHQINILNPDNAGNYLDALSLERQTNDANPFRDMEVSGNGLLYHNGLEITFHPNLDNPSVNVKFQPFEGEILAMAVREDLVFLEDLSGLKVFRLTPNALTLTGEYPHWFALSSTGDQIIARNRRDQSPGQYHALTPMLFGDRVLITSPYAFKNSDQPLLITTFAGDVLSVGATILESFRFACPKEEYTYLLPHADDLELELGPYFQETDLALLNIYDKDFNLIGVQTLSADRLADLDGKKIQDWVVDYDARKNPVQLVLKSSRELAPIVSGFHQSTKARFALRLQQLRGGPYYLPHIPRNDGWLTTLHLQGLSNQGNIPLMLDNTAGFSQPETLDTQESHRILIQPNQLPGVASWLRLTPERPQDFFSGFTVMAELTSGQTAAVPLVEDLSDFLVVPLVLGNSGSATAWTGLVLANTHPRVVTVRAVGYDEGGQITLDTAFDLAPNQSFVTLAEDWLTQMISATATSTPVQWIALFPDTPIMGMLLYGDQSDGRMAGLPLNSRCGSELLFTGIREGGGWETRIALTNTETYRTRPLVEGFDEYGKVVASARFRLWGRSTVNMSLASFFPETPPEELKKIRALTVRSNRNLMGFSMRSQPEAAIFETYTALVTQE